LYWISFIFIYKSVIHEQGYGEFQVIGGDGSTSGSYQGCGGSGGRIAMYFDRNFTFSGSWDVYGGDTPINECDGASGTAFFYHNGKHIVFLISVLKTTLKVPRPMVIHTFDISLVSYTLSVTHFLLSWLIELSCSSMY
jgi:hypothetical protein